MQNPREAYDFLIMFVSVTFLFLLLGTGISVFVVYYYRKRRFYIREKEDLQNQFEKSILQAQLEIQEHTLNHISQEIHDNVGQALSVTKMQLNILGENTTVYTPALQGAKDSLAKAMKDLRDLAKGLSSERVGHFSLLDSIREELERMRGNGSMDVNCVASGTEYPLQEEKKLIAFRMTQECIQNILKHAKASKMLLTLSYSDTSLTIAIQDNGIGFNVPEALEKKMGLGLDNIIKRASVIGGQAVITSNIEQGTNINIIIPYA